mmetsp:Transcript_38994/g.76647  ORF Transcript_38994/g.76647 Transcript_38994/m.76647 type:complete len:126 (-) Transcript_38994:1846-2223(-)
MGRQLRQAGSSAYLCPLSCFSSAFCGFLYAFFLCGGEGRCQKREMGRMGRREEGMQSLDQELFYMHACLLCPFPPFSPLIVCARLTSPNSPSLSQYPAPKESAPIENKKNEKTIGGVRGAWVEEA